MTERITEDERLDLHDNGRCPDCGAIDTMMLGAAGGLCQNIKCSGCGSMFNIIGRFGVERIGGMG